MWSIRGEDRTMRRAGEVSIWAGMANNSETTLQTQNRKNARRQQVNNVFFRLGMVFMVLVSQFKAKISFSWVSRIFAGRRSVRRSRAQNVRGKGPMIWVCIFAALWVQSLSADYIEVFPLTLGETIIQLVRWSPIEGCDPHSSFRFLNLHQNENTSVVAAKAFLLSMNEGAQLASFASH